MQRAAKIGAMLALGAIASAGAGCASDHSETVRAPDFPREKTSAGTLDIQIAREETEVVLTNTTARSFGACRLWLNEWFVRPLPSFAIGQTLRIPVREFRDRNGDSFRGGGFFATKAPERLASAHLETEDRTAALIVVRPPND